MTEFALLGPDENVSGAAVFRRPSRATGTGSDRTVVSLATDVRLHRFLLATPAVESLRPFASGVLVAAAQHRGGDREQHQHVAEDHQPGD
jgi:hypothetical protein